MRSYLVPLAAVVALLISTSAQAADPAVKCQSGKLKVAGKYASCLLSADSKAVKTNTSPDYSKCDAKYSSKWQNTEAKAGAGMCPGGDNDETAIQGFIDACDGVVADALAGGALPSDVVTCNADLGTCNGDLTTCNTDLDACLPLAGCAFRGVVGDWVVTLPDAIGGPDVCALSISLTSANAGTGSITACGYLAGATVTGTLTENVFTAAQDAAPICFGLYRLETTTTFGSCDTAIGSYVCRDGVGGPIVVTGTFTATRP